MIPSTTARVALHTTPRVNARIRRKTNTDIKKHSSNPAEIRQRLKQLDKEWDIERTLEVNGSTLLLIGLGLGSFVSKKWYLLPAFVGAFCLQHALQGWCPPIEIFRRLGIRTSKEIDEERTALKAIRGDFKPLANRKNHRSSATALKASRKS